MNENREVFGQSNKWLHDVVMAILAKIINDKKQSAVLSQGRVNGEDGFCFPVKCNITSLCAADITAADCVITKHETCGTSFPVPKCSGMGLIRNYTCLLLARIEWH